MDIITASGLSQVLFFLIWQLRTLRPIKNTSVIIVMSRSGDQQSFCWCVLNMQMSRRDDQQSFCWCVLNKQMSRRDDQQSFCWCVLNKQMLHCWRVRVPLSEGAEKFSPLNISLIVQMVVLGFTDSSDWLLWGLLIVQTGGFRGLLIVQTGCSGIYWLFRLVVVGFLWEPWFSSPSHLFGKYPFIYVFCVLEFSFNFCRNLQ